MSYLVTYEDDPEGRTLRNKDQVIEYLLSLLDRIDAELDVRVIRMR